MSTPSGVLAWGQAGNYNAIDDRAVIAALYASGRPDPTYPGGVVIPCTLAAGSGLVVNIGAWGAVVDCGDGTKAVLTSPASTITENAGGGTARTDILWADISPDNATWSVSLITETAMVGRSGVYLGMITVPSGAGTAAAMTFRAAQPRLLGLRMATSPNVFVNGTSFQTVASLTIPAYDAVSGAVYQIEVWGAATQGNGQNQRMDFQLNVGGQVGNNSVSFGTTAFGSGNQMQYFPLVRARVAIYATGTSGQWGGLLEAHMSVFGQNTSPSNSNFASAISGDGNTTPTINTTRDTQLQIQTRFAATGGGPSYISHLAMAGRIA